jgi:hypothetical protein
MKEMLEKTSTEMLREYFYDLRGCYPPTEFTREMLIRILVNNK